MRIFANSGTLTLGGYRLALSYSRHLLITLSLSVVGLWIFYRAPLTHPASIVRASTQNMLDDIERAVDDAANAFRTMLKDGRFVAGAGATEIELARRLFTFAEASPGVEQYAIKKFAEALEVVPRTLAENAGLPASDTVAALYAAHSAGKIHEGIGAWLSRTHITHPTRTTPVTTISNTHNTQRHLVHTYTDTRAHCAPAYPSLQTLSRARSRTCRPTASSTRSSPRAGRSASPVTQW